MKLLIIIAGLIVTFMVLFLAFGLRPIACQLEIEKFSVINSTMLYVFKVKFNADSGIEFWDEVNGVESFESEGGGTRSNDPIFSKTISNMFIRPRMMSSTKSIVPGYKVIFTPNVGSTYSVTKDRPFCYFQYLDGDGNKISKLIKVVPSKF